MKLLLQIGGMLAMTAALYALRMPSDLEWWRILLGGALLGLSFGLLSHVHREDLWTTQSK